MRRRAAPCRRARRGPRRRRGRRSGTAAGRTSRLKEQADEGTRGGARCESREPAARRARRAGRSAAAHAGARPHSQSKSSDGGESFRSLRGTRTTRKSGRCGGGGAFRATLRKMSRASSSWRRGIVCIAAAVAIAGAATEARTTAERAIADRRAPVASHRRREGTGPDDHRRVRRDPRVAGGNRTGRVGRGTSIRAAPSPRGAQVAGRGSRTRAVELNFGTRAVVGTLTQSEFLWPCAKSRDSR